MTVSICSNRVAEPSDIARARRTARILAAALAFSEQDQTRIATAVSEIARNSLRYAGSGQIDFSLVGDQKKSLFRIAISDRGPGISDLDDILQGRYRSRTGMGMGLVGVRSLVDDLGIETGPQGTVVTLDKRLPPGLKDDLGDISLAAANALRAQKPHDSAAELEHQNWELLASLEQLKRREDELEIANRDLTSTTNRLNANLQRTEFLLREVHHRVKNNLQLISSLVSMQLRTARGRETRDALRSLTGRIQALGFVHGKLYQARAFSSVELGDYLAGLCSGLKSALISSDRQIEIVVKADPVAISQELAMDLGLLVNELVTNACKHAFDERMPGMIEVIARQVEDNVVLTVSDNGTGIDDDLLHQDTTESLGVKVLYATVRKLRGELSFESHDGLSVRVVVPLPSYRPQP